VNIFQHVRYNVEIISELFRAAAEIIIFHFQARLHVKKTLVISKLFQIILFHL